MAHNQTNPTDAATVGGATITAVTRKSATVTLQGC